MSPASRRDACLVCYIIRSVREYDFSRPFRRRPKFPYYCGQDGTNSLFVRRSRQFLPGYCRAVPTGQLLTAYCSLLTAYCLLKRYRTTIYGIFKTVRDSG